MTKNEIWEEWLKNEVRKLPYAQIYAAPYVEIPLGVLCSIQERY